MFCALDGSSVHIMHLFTNTSELIIKRMLAHTIRFNFRYIEKQYLTSEGYERSITSKCLCSIMNLFSNKVNLYAYQKSVANFVHSSSPLSPSQDPCSYQKWIVGYHIAQSENVCFLRQATSLCHVICGTQSALCVN